MANPHLTNISATQTKDTPMLEPQPFKLQHRSGLRFRPHDGSDRPQPRYFVPLWDAASKIQMHRSDMPAAYAPQHTDRLFDSIVAAFSEVEMTMALDLAVKLKQSLMQTWKDNVTRVSFLIIKVTDRTQYKKLTGTNGLKKQLHYPDWFFMAVLLGPGHPLLKSIRKDMSDLWGVQFPTDAIIYPKFIPIETQMSLFYGKPVTAPKEDSIEERAKAIKKSIDDSTVNGLNAAIKGHLPDHLNRDSARMQTLETSLASTNRELLGATKQVRNLEKQLAEAKASQALASIEQEKTKSDMETLRKEIQLLKTARTDNVKKEDLEALRVTLTQHSESCQQRVVEIETKALREGKKVEREFILLRSEVAQSAEKAEKAVRTGALVLSVLSTPGGQKRKMDEIS